MKSEDWNARLGDLIEAIGTPRFAPMLANALRGLVPIDYIVVFAYRGGAAPLSIHDDFPAEKRKIFVTDYQDGPYLLDPFYLATRGEHVPDLYRLKDIAPDRFYQGEYFRSYYVQTGLSEEIGFLADLPGEVTVVISLMRAATSPAFGVREFRRLKEVEPIVRASARQNWRDLEQHFMEEGEATDRPGIRQHIDRAFQTFGRDHLTPREREVVEFTLKGHSAEAVGKILGISSGTVRIHRRNIYAKLRIRSQGELFSHFIGALMDDTRA